MCFFPIRRFKLDQNHQKQNRLAAQLFKIKNLFDAHHFFDPSTLELITFMFLLVAHEQLSPSYPPSANVLVTGSMARAAQLQAVMHQHA